MKLYDLPRGKGVRLYGAKAKDTGDDVVIIFGHIDGAYSYCWIEGSPDKIVHLSASTPITEHNDGYLIDGGA